jgi:hypothetical protein
MHSMFMTPTLHRSWISFLWFALWCLFVCCQLLLLLALLVSTIIKQQAPNSTAIHCLV